MRHARRQQTDRRQLLGLRQLCLQLHAIGDVVDQHDPPHHCKVPRQQGSNRDVGDARLARRQRQTNLVERMRRPARLRTLSKCAMNSGGKIAASAAAGPRARDGHTSPPSARSSSRCGLPDPPRRRQCGSTPRYSRGTPSAARTRRSSAPAADRVARSGSRCRCTRPTTPEPPCPRWKESRRRRCAPDPASATVRVPPPSGWPPGRADSSSDPAARRSSAAHREAAAPAADSRKDVVARSAAVEVQKTHVQRAQFLCLQIAESVRGGQFKATVRPPPSLAVSFRPAIRPPASSSVARNTATRVTSSVSGRRFTMEFTSAPKSVCEFRLRPKSISVSR